MIDSSVGTLPTSSARPKRSQAREVACFVGARGLLGQVEIRSILLGLLSQKEKLVSSHIQNYAISPPFCENGSECCGEEQVNRLRGDAQTDQ